MSRYPVSHLFSSVHFDLAASAFALTASLKKWGSEASFSGSLITGVQLFSLTALFDRALRLTLGKEGKKGEASFKTGAIHALLEEGLYAGVLLTQSSWWMIPRFGASLFTGMTAARSLLNRTHTASPKEGFSQDTRIGFAWAIARESLLLTLSPTYSQPLLVAADSAVFALSEVCPFQKSKAIPKFSGVWFSKVLSSAFFRATANTAALAKGITASLAQHLLFNASRTLPD